MKIKNYNNIVEFACCSDENYSHYFLILLTSIMKKASCKNLYVCHYFQDNVNEQTLENIKLLASFFNNLQLNIYSLDELNLPLNLNDHGRYSRASFGRLKFPEFFKTKSKIIYLDVDMFVCDDIEKMYKTDIKDFYLGASRCYGCVDSYNKNKIVKNIWTKLENKYREITLKEYFNKVLKLDCPKNYFTSGLLIMNLDKMRQDNISEKCLNFITEYEPILPDQDALNKFCGANYLLLKPKWNLSYYRAFINKDIPRNEKFDYILAKMHPGVVSAKDNIFQNKKNKWLSSYYKNLVKFIEKNVRNTNIDESHTVINFLGIKFKFKKKIEQ